MAQYPHRVRLHRGRNVHAARPINGDHNNLVTACGNINVAGDQTHPNDTPITCRDCQRRIAREEYR